MTIRGKYWLQAAENITGANQLDMGDPDFWALMLSALVNASMASASDATMTEVEELTKPKRRVQKRVQKAIKDELNG